MDYSIAPPVKRRSFVRRLATWTVALGILGGGGFGAYRYGIPWVKSAQAAPATSGETANDRLMAAMPGRSSSPSQYTTPQESDADRYGGATPVLPPAASDDEVATPRSAESVEAPANPFATSPLNGYAGRYTPPTSTSQAPAAAAPSDGAATTTTPDAPSAAAIQSTDADVARGQEPQSRNPLRSGARSTPAATPSSDESAEARAAFSGDTLPPAELALPPRVAAQMAARTGAAGGADATSPTDAARYGSSVAVGSAPTSPAEPPIASPSQATPLATTNPYMSAPTPAPTSPTAGPTGYGAGAANGLAGRSPYGGAAQMPQQAPAAQTNPYGEQFAGSPADSSITPTPGLSAADGTGRPGERILEGVQSPTLTIQKLAPPEIQVGKRCTFAIRVQNNSQRTAHNVQVVDEVPLGTQLMGSAPKANVSGSQVVWDLGTLGAGEERIVEMELMPTEEGELGSVASVSYSTQASAKSRCTRPQLALRLAANPRVMIGDQQIVQVEVSNPGSGDATSVMLLESIPPGVTHEAGPALEFEIGTLHAGESKKIDLVLQADAAGMVNNVMTARADANLQVQADCKFEVIAPALKVSVEGPAKRILERPATYKISVNNPGTADAKDVQLVTQLPKGLKYVSANNYGEYDAATNCVYWSLAELPANGQGTVELTTLAVEAGDQTLQFATRAKQGLEDRTEKSIRVEGIVALSFEVQDVLDAIPVGGETSYEIKVTNQGSKVATNVQVVAQLQPGLRAKPGQGDSRFTIQGDKVIFAPLPQLAPKADVSFRFGVQGVRAGDQRVTLQVVTDEVREPIVEVESTQVYADE